MGSNGYLAQVQLPGTKLTTLVGMFEAGRGQTQIGPIWVGGLIIPVKVKTMAEASDYKGSAFKFKSV